MFWRVLIINAPNCAVSMYILGSHEGSRVGLTVLQLLVSNNLLTRMLTIKASIVPPKMPDTVFGL